MLWIKNIQSVFNLDTAFFISKSSLWLLLIFHIFFLHMDHVFLYILEQIKYLCNSYFILCILKSLYSGLWEYKHVDSGLLWLLYSSVSAPCLYSFLSHTHRLTVKSLRGPLPSLATLTPVLCSPRSVRSLALFGFPLPLVQFGNCLQAVNRDHFGTHYVYSQSLKDCVNYDASCSVSESLVSCVLSDFLLAYLWKNTSSLCYFIVTGRESQ